MCEHMSTSPQRVDDIVLHMCEHMSTSPQRVDDMVLHVRAYVNITTKSG